MDATDFATLLTQLASADPARREVAADQLHQLGRRGLSRIAARQAVRAAVSRFPARQFEFSDTAQDLMWAVGNRPHAELIPAVFELYGLMNERARGAALRVLARLPQRAAAVAYVALLEQYGWPADVTAASWMDLERAPRHADVLFPALVRVSHRSFNEMAAWELAVTYCRQHLLNALTRARIAPLALDAARRIMAVLAPHQNRPGVTWMWQPDYADDRFAAGLLFDMLGYFPLPTVRALLRSALTLRDPRPRTFAALSLLRLNEPVDAAILAACAASSELRIILYEQLAAMGRSDLFPAEFHNQQAFAESDLVNWLAFPAELGCPPDEIELMEVVGVHTGTPDGVIDYYVFRFRTRAPHWAAEDGWMAGVSGPFLRKDTPTPVSGGDTFSAFEPWDGRPAVAHLGDLEDIVDAWRERHYDDGQ